MSVGFVLAAVAATLSAGTTDAQLEQMLRAKDQALLDAIAPGDRATWDAAMAPEALYLDENNVTMSRATYLEQLKPLPPNTSGHIQIAEYRMARSGDVATVIHKDAETEIYHGQTLRSTFLMSETWRATPGGWKLMLLHTSDVLKDPPATPLPAAALAEYAGTFRAGPDLSYVVTVKDGVLIGSRNGGASVGLSAELKDVFFVSGQPRTRKIFQRGAGGGITGFVDRREGTDIAWTKVPSG